MEPNNSNISVDTLLYTAEGAANVLYRIRDPKYAGFLLRLRKKMPSQPSSIEVLDFMESKISPLFDPGMIALMKPILLDREVLARLNELLLEMDNAGQRDPKRRGTYLDIDEPYGMLIEDMTIFGIESSLPVIREVHEKIKNSSSQLNCIIRSNLRDASRLEISILEFKPKWLIQSKDAPENWVHCRTCALRLMRQAKGKDPSLYPFCPLDLVSGDKQRIGLSVQAILPDSLEEQLKDNTLNLKRLRTIIEIYILNASVFKRLADIQSSMDREGILNASGNFDSMNFLIAMTVRDCTAFLKVVYDTDIEQESARQDTFIDSGIYSTINLDGLLFRVSCRLADLDIKDGSGTKRIYWQELERRLISGNWYAGLNSTFRPCR
ncbi:inositol-pentakisphosphate 2-kinase [Dipodascopsis uninucleata]